MIRKVGKGGQAVCLAMYVRSVVTVLKLDAEKTMSNFIRLLLLLHSLLSPPLPLLLPPLFPLLPPLLLPFLFLLASIFDDDVEQIGDSLVLLCSSIVGTFQTNLFQSRFLRISGDEKDVIYAHI